MNSQLVFNDTFKVEIRDGIAISTSSGADHKLVGKTRSEILQMAAGKHLRIAEFVYDEGIWVPVQ